MTCQTGRSAAVQCRRGRGRSAARDADHVQLRAMGVFDDERAIDPRTKGSDVATVDQQASLADAAAQLRDLGVGALVVVRRRPATSTASSPNATSCGRSPPTGRARSAARSARRCRPTSSRAPCGDSVEELMVVDDRAPHPPPPGRRRRPGCSSGIVSIGDVVKARLGQLEHENAALFEYLTRAADGQA